MAPHELIFDRNRILHPVFQFLYGICYSRTEWYSIWVYGIIIANYELDIVAPIYKNKIKLPCIILNQATDPILGFIHP